MSLDNELADQFDEYIGIHGYTNRSEAMRDLIRRALHQDQIEASTEGHCVAALSYVYNHHELELASRITRVHHHHHDISLANMHVHLDHDNCLEIAILRGAIKDVQEAANVVISERGVRHGKLYMVPVAVSESNHSTHGVPHVHSHPLT